ncbi:MAG TPA: SidA/IucD/PvdA family monooxygenase [Actinophytocola sp.]|uniref:lysine N(6)-hydroxylase/L-ornithine N(5)-oxygenase family protein n=1 Tax=Actinophytocola sp. TaxID=1872138 RepID=UPI002DBDAE88|nr:SidA/IucD/PvdA family monooxygenase [Actinophytocola sp.]HEU5470235.1 SidA/IucD/PvdA family monooxygenase [Actinophytocola sp.]
MTKQLSAARFDVVGVGLGPCNLSLAALFEPLTEIRARFVEARSTFQWHCGIMVPGAELQVSFLKDLVTLVDPSSSFSFLNYLASQGRLYRFLIAHGDRCSRQEFEQYYQWAASRLPDIAWDHRVESVELRDDLLEVRCAGRDPVRTANLVLGSGRTPQLPGFAAKLRGSTVLHSAEFRMMRRPVAGQDILVIGAGQSGAEVVNHLLGGELGLPRSVTWVSSRLGFLPLDDSPFSNEWFQPDYVEHFYGLPAGRRRALLDRQRLASDGVSESLLREIYRRLYDLDTLQSGRLRHRLLVCRRVIDLALDHNRLVATIHDEDTDTIETADADIVICATGYRSGFPDYLEPLRGRLLDGSGGLRVRRDYSLDWDAPPGLGIYVQNAAEQTHGIADPNLSLAAWRSARIVNAICGRPAYRIEDARSTISWRGTGQAFRPEDELLPDTAGVNLP